MPSGEGDGYHSIAGDATSFDDWTEQSGDWEILGDEAATDEPDAEATDVTAAAAEADGPVKRTFHIELSARETMKTQDWSGQARISKGRIVQVAKTSGASDTIHADKSWTIVYGRSLKVSRDVLTPATGDERLELFAPDRDLQTVADQLGPAIDRAMEATSPAFDDFDDEEGLEDIAFQREAEAQSLDELGSDPSIDDTPVVRFINKVLLDAIRKGASDIHFEPYESRYRIRYRLDGVLKNMAGPPVQMSRRLSSRLKVMAGLDIAEKRVPQDGRIKLNLSRKKSI